MHLRTLAPISPPPPPPSTRVSFVHQVLLVSTSSGGDGVLLSHSSFSSKFVFHFLFLFPPSVSFSCFLVMVLLPPLFHFLFALNVYRTHTLTGHAHSTTAHAHR